jgi:predicted MFS family arabinose efflux permease
MTGVLVLISMGVLYAVVPEAPQQPRPAGTRGFKQFAAVLRDPQLARLDYGIFALHAVLMALFIAIPLELRAAGLPVDQHWQVYLPVILGSFVLMLPAVLGPGRQERMQAMLMWAIAVLLGTQLLLPLLAGGVWGLAALLLAFFTAFNVLEAGLPSLVSRVAPRESRGIAIGVFASLQFFGTFIGAAAGGFLYGRWGTTGVVIFSTALLVIWIIAVRAPGGGQRGV